MRIDNARLNRRAHELLDKGGRRVFSGELEMIRPLSYNTSIFHLAIIVYGALSCIDRPYRSYRYQNIRELIILVSSAD
jgi:hypothetical protein